MATSAVFKLIWGTDYFVSVACANHLDESVRVEGMLLFKGRL